MEPLITVDPAQLRHVPIVHQAAVVVVVVVVAQHIGQHHHHRVLLQALLPVHLIVEEVLREVHVLLQEVLQEVLREVLREDVDKKINNAKSLIMKKLLFIFVSFLFISNVNAQTLADVIRYSRSDLQGTARAAAMGNAFGSLGGDFTSVSINPAGLGVYRSDEFSLTAAYTGKNVNANYLGMDSKESTSFLSIPSMGYVSSFKNSSSNRGSLVNINFGVGFNRTNNFKINRYVSGNDARSSMLDFFVENANEVGNSDDLDDFYEKAAWETYMLDYGVRGQLYSHRIADGGYGQNQIKSFSQSGYTNEYNFSIGLNFNHKIYAGFSLGIQDLYFKETTELVEFDPGNKFDNFKEYSFFTYLKTDGVGVNGKLGLIIKPVNELRLGVALHTPTFYSFDDFYYNDMTSVATDDDGVMTNYTYNSPDGKSKYEFQSPWKAVFSASFVGKVGLISVDCDFIDYSSAKLRSGGSSLMREQMREQIEQSFKPVANLHVGGEFKVNDSFSLRAGMEYMPGPYKKVINGVELLNGNNKAYTYSGGVGWRSNGFFVDLAYKYYTNNHYMDIYIPSSTNQVSPTRFKDAFDYLSLTFGFRF